MGFAISSKQNFKSLFQIWLRLSQSIGKQTTHTPQPSHFTLKPWLSPQGFLDDRGSGRGGGVLSLRKSVFLWISVWLDVTCLRHVPIRLWSRNRFSVFKGKKGLVCSWPEEVTGKRVRGRVVVEPAVVSVCIVCILAPLLGPDPPPLYPGILGSSAAQGWKMRATVEERAKKRSCWESNVWQKRKLALMYTCSAFCLCTLVFLQSFLTSTSPVSFSLRTKLSRSRSGPAINLRKRGRSFRGSFWNRSAGTMTTENERIAE